MKHYFSRLLLMVMFIPWVLQAQTTPAPASLPYSCGFEDATENANWTIVNGDATNKFFIGSAVNNGGTQSLYISNNNGVSNDYTVLSDAGYVYAYREISVTDLGVYTVSLDWRAKGESTFDYLRVFLIPDNAADALTPHTSGVAAHTGVTATGSPASWIAVDNNVKLNLQDSVQTFVSGEIALAVGTYKLVLYWRNDGSGGTNPPAFVDNISVAAITCPTVHSLTVEEISEYSATISWNAYSSATSFVVEYDTAGFTPGNGQTINTADTAIVLNNLQPNTKYELYVQALCGDESTRQVGPLKFTTNCLPIDLLPFVETFDSYTTDISTGTSAPSTYPNHTLPSCWSFLEMGASGNPQIFLSNSTTYAENGNCLFFRSSTTPVYAVMPYIDEDINLLQLSFTHRHENVKLLRK